MKHKIQLIETVIQAANDVVTIKEELNKSYQFLTGISILEGLGNSSTIQTSSVDGDELFPKGFETAFFQSGSEIAPNERMYHLHDRPADGKRIEMTIQDDGNAPAYPFTLKIYLRLENNQNK